MPSGTLSAGIGWCSTNKDQARNSTNRKGASLVNNEAVLVNPLVCIKQCKSQQYLF